MASTNFANRYGLNVKLYKHPKADSASAVTTIDFANECTLELSSDIVWATGGQNAANRIGFRNPIEGTFTISTQIMTDDLKRLLTGADLSAEGTEITFKNDGMDDETVYYVIEGDTVWKGEGGDTKAEHIVCHKALPRRAYNVTYNGSSDPTSVSIEFELLADTETGTKDKVVTITTPVASTD